jgi:SDR family mycofactocin-dependent oxidoreductase
MGMGELAGKVVLISGVARGQGRSHAVRLASAGADIIGLDICQDIDTMEYPNASKADLEETVRLVEAQGRRIIASVTDVRDALAVEQAVDDGATKLGRLDIILAQAGIARWKPGASMAEKAAVWDDITGVNLGGYFHLLEAGLPHIVAGGRGGSVVMTGSTAATRPMGATDTGHIAYVAAKHGVVGLMKVYALAYAQHDIRFNVVHPTGVVSGMTMNAAMRRLHEEAQQGGQNLVSGMTNLLDVDMLQPEDISDAVAYLVSDRAKWVTGTEIKVDAGFSLK